MLYDFFMLLRRYKVSSLLNVAGMSLAFAAAYLLLVQVVYDFSYNRPIPNSERIYRMEYPSWSNDGSWSTNWNRHNPLQYSEGIPEIETRASLCCDSWPDRFSIKRENTIDNLKLNASSSEREGLDVFGFECVAGSFDDFTGEATAILSESAAARHGLQVGDILHKGLGAKEKMPTLTIVAIFRDFDSPSTLAHAELFTGMKPLEQHDQSQWNDPFYLRLADGSSPEMVEAKLRNNVLDLIRAEGYTEEEIEQQIDEFAPRLHNLLDLYYAQGVDNNDGPKGNKATTWTLLAIAALIIVIAFINFINFFFALMPVRIRAVNTRKIFGASNMRLRMSFLVETVGLILLSLYIACCIVVLATDSTLADYLSTSPAISRNLPLAGGFVVGAMLVGVVVSLYPTCYITSFAPAFVIKGAFHATRSGRLLRYTLIGVQYVISITLIIVSLFIHMQHNHMMKYDMGFNRNNILSISGVPTGSYEAMEFVSDRLKQNAIVTDVTFGMGDMVQPTRMSWGCDLKGRSIYFQCFPVAWNFLQFMGIELTEGRHFTPDDYQREGGVFIFNESARSSYEMTLDDQITGHVDHHAEIAGFCKNFHSRPLQYGVEPFAFYVYGKEAWEYPDHIYVRIAEGTPIREAIDYLRRTMKELAPSIPDEDIRIRLFDEELGRYYQAEERLARLVSIFSLLSIVISVLGVLGLVLFETQYRRKEIGIRRVNGAMVGSILTMFNLQFFRIVAVCAVIALPVSYIIVSRWLEGFVSRMPIHVWIFAVAVAIVAAITAVTVTVCSWRAANENPTDMIGH